jgi:hypothetical protein
MVTRPVVFVPGLPGSHLKKAATGDLIFLDVSALLFHRDRILPDLMGPDDLSDRSVVPAHPIRSAAKFLVFDLAKQAQSLYDVLRSIGYETVEPNSLFEALGWDWRKPVDDDLVRSSLRSAILRLEHDSGRKPVAIVHSTGGLVLRAVLEAEPELADHLDGVIAFGVPWGGTLRTLPLLRGLGGFGPVPKEDTQRVMAHSWAAFDLLPPAAANDLLGLTLDGAGNPVDVLAERSWFADTLRPAMDLRADHSVALHLGRTPALDLGGRSLPITNVVGFGADTLLRARLAADGTITLEEGKDDRSLDDGDGTVPRRSAAWLAGSGVRTFHLPIGFYPGHFVASFHNALWKNPGGQDLLWSLLADEPWLPFVHLALDGEDVNAPAKTLRLRATALAQNGAPLKDVAVKFTGLTGGKKATKAAENGGRSLFTVPRTAIRKTSDGRFRRLTVQVTWKGGKTEERSFLIPP